MPHFFIDSKNVDNNKILINDIENYRHIAKSLRARIGETILLIDENQLEYEGIIFSITNKEIIVEIQNSYPSKRKLDFEIHLAQSPLRSDAQNTVIEKATELGVEKIYPVITDNCALNKELIEKKITKWQKIMYEASKQCERANIPTCENATTIEDLIKSKAHNHVIAFCERYSTKTFREYVNNNKNLFDKDTKLLLIIGPEGGFSDREFNYFKTNNIPMLTLGDLILKADTAVITAIGNIIYEYNSSK